MTTRQGSSSSSFPNNWTYDVFLSFRGADTRIGFTGFLYNALCQRGIRTFKDDEELKRGEEIVTRMVKAIEESRIAIVVFSENYASSRFCLDQLVHIIAWMKEKGRLVLPVFYKVDPSQVRRQTGSYGEAFARYESDEAAEKVQKWRSALSMAANLSGFYYGDHSSGYEFELIERIIEKVSTIINNFRLYVANYPVGLESRVHEVNSLLDVGSDDEVNMVAIYGMGGSGKSTVGRAVYNLVADVFECSYFLSNVREKTNKQGLAILQETLLFGLTGERNIKIGDVDRGISILKSRLRQKKVLLVLDDINKLEQLRALAGGVDWFGFGSRIIITTRDAHLLNAHGIERVYHMKELSHEEALELFKWKAFRSGEVHEDFQAIVEHAVNCCHGLPLALEVLGSLLCGRSIQEWYSFLDKYEKSSVEQVQEVLKVSYDSLEQLEKEIFLDIACFFNGETLQYVKNILLHSHGFSPEYAIQILVDKSLIKITEYSKSEEKVEVHRLIQDMCRNIVKQESPKPGRRSRLWFHEDIIHVLESNKGTNKINSILLDLEKHEVQWSGDEFKKMTNLRVLIIKDVKFSQSPTFLPNSLRVLHWKRYPSSSLPSDFHPKRLVILNLYGSFFTWAEASKKFEMLREIKLVHCNFLEQVPDLSEARNLTELHLDFCNKLTEIHDSVGFLDKLRILSAKSCVSLKIFPRFIKLESLETLNLMCCSSLQYFPEVLGNMDNLSYLSLRETAIEEFPSSIENVTGLFCLDLSFCQRLKKVPTCILLFPKLERLHFNKEARFQFIKNEMQKQVISTEKQICLGGCNFLDGFLPTFLGSFPNMTSLELCGCNLTILPECIQECLHLSDLNLDNCKQLKEIRAIPPKIKVLSARNCTALNSSSLKLLLDENVHSRGNTCFTLPGARIPKWVDHHGKKASLSFWFRNKFPDVVQFVVGKPMFGSLSFNCSVSVNGRVFDESYHSYSELETEHAFLYNLRPHCDGDLEKHEMVYPEEEWNHAEISFVSKSYELGRRQKPLVQETGVYIFDRDRIERDILFTNPNQLKWNYKILGLKCCLLLLRVMAIASGY